MRYFEIAWLSKYDGPGNRVVLFLQGCHLRCPWCHSPHSWEFNAPILFNETRCLGCYLCLEACTQGVHVVVDGIHQLQRESCQKCGKCVEACPTSRRESNTGALVLPTQELTPSEIFELLRPQLEVVRECGGITLSGGEALLQKEEVYELLRLCKTSGFHTALETSLTLSREIYEYVGDVVDCWLIGIRDRSLVDDARRMDNSIAEREMKKNIQYLSSLGKKVIIRYPVIRGYTTTDTQLNRLVAQMNLGGFINIEILPCNRDMEYYYVLTGIKPKVLVGEIMPDEVELNRVAGFFVEQGFHVEIKQ